MRAVGPTPFRSVMKTPSIRCSTGFFPRSSIFQIRLRCARPGNTSGMRRGLTPPMNRNRSGNRDSPPPHTHTQPAGSSAGQAGFRVRGFRVGFVLPRRKRLGSARPGGAAREIGPFPPPLRAGPAGRAKKKVKHKMGKLGGGDGDATATRRRGWMKRRLNGEGAPPPSRRGAHVREVRVATRGAGARPGRSLRRRGRTADGRQRARGSQALATPHDEAHAAGRRRLRVRPHVKFFRENGEFT